MQTSISNISFPSHKFIVNEKGRPTDVVLSVSEWRKITQVIEEFKDIRAYDKAKAKNSDPIPLKEALKNL